MPRSYTKGKKAPHSQEFQQMIKLCLTLEPEEKALCSIAYFAFQLAMILRLDNSAKFHLPDLKPYAK